MAWTGKTFSVGAILTAADMNNLQADITALANGDTGAPEIVQAALADNSVGQAQLKDSTSAQSVVVPTTSSASISLTGGTYSMVTSISASIAGLIPPAFGGNNLAAGVFGFYNQQASLTATIYMDSRYFSASPPYTFGRLFIYVLLGNSTGEILATSVGGDPTWAYHGKTNITPQRIDKVTGKQYRIEKTVGGILVQDLYKHKTILDDYLAGNINIVEEEIEIDLAYKDRDIEDKCNPWCENPPEFFIDKTVVLLTPENDKLEHVLYDIMKDATAKELFNLVEAGYLTIDNVPIVRDGVPSKIITTKASWKNTL